MSALVLLTFLLMALTTYLTRLGGYLVLRNRELGPKWGRVMEAVPGCVLVAVIAPHFATGRPADLSALAITLVAASRLPMLPTVLISVISAGLLRQVL